MEEYIDIKKYIYENNICEQNEIGEVNEEYYFEKVKEKNIKKK